MAKVTRRGWCGEWTEELPEGVREEEKPAVDDLLPVPVAPDRRATPSGKRLDGQYPRGTTKKQMFWDKAIVALLTHPTLTSAARELGVDSHYLSSWLKDPEFLAQLDAARKQRVAHALVALHGSYGRIIEKLWEIVNDPESRHAERLGALKLLADKASDLIAAERAESAAKERAMALEKVAENVIAGRLGGEDECAPAIPERSDGDTVGGEARAPSGEEGGGAAEASPGVADERV